MISSNAIINIKCSFAYENQIGTPPFSLMKILVCVKDDKIKLSHNCHSIIISIIQ